MVDALSYLALLGDNPFEVMLTFLRNGGIFLFLFLLYFFAWKGWVAYVQGVYGSTKKFVLLAIDIPRVNEQSMKAVEQIITTLHGIHKGPNKKETYWDGVGEDSFSLEIVSIDGYIQYFVRCDDYNMDLVKGAFFAQYPDAEIIEVEDYVNAVPQKFPDEEIDMWGTEFVLTNNPVYPIKTYEHFEHSLTGIFADPMAAILEALSRLRPGEQVWLQILITPLGSDWRDAGMDEVNSLIGKSVAKKSRLGAIGKLPMDILDEARRQVFSVEGSFLGQGGDAGGSESNFGNLTTGEQMVVEEVQKKISRLAFETKFRMLYIAPKEVMHGGRVINSVFGSLKQFNTLDLNGFTVGKATTSSPSYFFVERRQTKKKNIILQAYRDRDTGTGDTGYALSTTELATIFHFPVDTVRAPLVSRTTSKKSEPPAGLPLENISPFEGFRQTGATDAQGNTGPEGVNSSTVKEAEIDPLQKAPEALVIPAAVGATPSLHSMPGLPPGVNPVADPHEHSVAKTVPQEPTVSPQELAQQGGSLHSMPGLPPGVRPIGAPLRPEKSPDVFAAPQKIVVPAQTRQPTQQAQSIEQTAQQPSRVVPPPDYFAPLHQQPQPVQQPVVQSIPVQSPVAQQPYTPPVAQSQPAQLDQNNVPVKKESPPTNLPIG